MKRALMQAYVKGSDKAAAFYQKAFDAPITASYLNSDGTYMHCELDIQGQILAISERNSEFAISCPSKLPSGINPTLTPVRNITKPINVKTKPTAIF